MKKRLGYRLFKHYVRFLLNHMLYRRHYILGKENLPAIGEHCVIPANHQNAAIDPIAMVLSHPQPVHPYVLAMGGVFTWSPIINMIWDWVGMLPAFRMDFEGVDEALKRTKYVVDFAAEKITEGNPVMLFPEANHHVEHWMRIWQVGYLEIAFKAAEKMNFEKDVKIIPLGHHYSSYYGARGSYLLHYGEPFSLMPYYEEYKEHPRTTMRKINPILREKVKGMMLYTDDLEHEGLFDFVRLSQIGIDHAQALHINPDYLPDRLTSDQQVFAKLDHGTELHPEKTEQLMQTWQDIRQAEDRLHLREHAFERASKHLAKKSWCVIHTVISVLLHILMLPLWLFSLIPCGIFYYIPPMFMPGKEDPYYKVYTQSMQLIVSVLVFIPLCVLAAILVLGLCWGWWWQAVVWILTWPLFGLFAWYYGSWMRQTFERVMMLTHPKQTKRLAELYNTFYKQANELINAQ